MRLLFLLVCIAVACVMLGWSGSRYAAAARAADESEAALVNVSLQAEELARLRAAAPPESRRERPRPGVSSRLAAVAATAGLHHGSLQSVTPEAESAVGQSFRRVAVRVTLDPVTLPELGRFLQEWRTAEPAWVASDIDLTPTSSQSKGSQRPLRAVLLFECVFASKESADGRP